MRSIETIVASVLVVGALLGIALMTFGLAAYEIETHTGRPVSHAFDHHDPHTSAGPLRTVARGLRERPPDPLAISALGTIVLLLTPGAGVVAATIAFARAGHRRYTMISLGVLLAMLLSFALGAGS
jgi:uncharacterized membrane protein